MIHVLLYQVLLAVLYSSTSICTVCANLLDTDLLNHRDGFILELHQPVRWHEYISILSTVRR